MRARPQIVVKVHFLLNPDGTVSGLPEVLNSSSDPLFTVDRAIGRFGRDELPGL